MGLQRHLGRATGILITGTLGVALLSGSGLFARADGDSAPGQRTGSVNNPVLDIELIEAPLQQALRIVELKSGINYILINHSYCKVKCFCMRTTCSIGSNICMRA